MNGKAFSLLFFGLNDFHYPYTRISHEILKYCADHGAQVSAFCMRKRSSEVSLLDERIKLSECPDFFENKSLTYISYSFFSFFYVIKTFFRNNNTCFIVPTTPPFTLAFMISITKLLTFGKLKWVYHVQDIHPEISFVGKNKTKKYNFLKALDTFFIKQSNKTITLSYEMKRTLVDRKINSHESIEVVNNFVEKFSTSNEIFDFIEADRIDDKVIYVFSGNVGKYQRVAEVVKSFLQLDGFEGVLYVLGDGDELLNVRNVVSNHINRNRVRLFGKRPFNEANQIASRCDYGIVSLNPKITKYAYPSKFATYLSMGLKVLAFVEHESQISDEIRTHELGHVISRKEMLNDLIPTLKKITELERASIVKSSMSLFGKEKLINSNFEILERIK